MAHIPRESRCTSLSPRDYSSRATWKTSVRHNLLAVQNQFARTLHRERNPTRRAADWTGSRRFLPPTRRRRKKSQVGLGKLPVPELPGSEPELPEPEVPDSKFG